MTKLVFVSDDDASPLVILPAYLSREVVHSRISECARFAPQQPGRAAVVFIRDWIGCDLSLSSSPIRCLADLAEAAPPDLIAIDPWTWQVIALPDRR